MAKRKQPRPDPTAMYVAWTSFAVAGDDHRVVRRGGWLRGDAPIVRATPAYFLPADTPPELWPSEVRYGEEEA
jgi:hypothetical protein